MKTIIFILLTLSVVYSTDEPECSTFESIYGSGTALCEQMWGDAFKVVDDGEYAYTMWWFGSENANNEISDNINASVSHADRTDWFDDGTEFCHLDYFHRETPAPLTDEHIECHPWKEDACCDAWAVAYPGAFATAYGDEYKPDRCGPLSAACMRFFVYEGCFYECDPHIGLYRKWHTDVYDECCDPYSSSYDTDACDGHSGCTDEHNAWEVYQMPIQKDFCDSWYDACRFDSFCAADGGNFFSCAQIYEAADDYVVETTFVEVPEKLTDGEIAGIVIGCIVCLAIIGTFLYCWMKTKNERDLAYLQLGTKQDSEQKTLKIQNVNN